MIKIVLGLAVMNMTFLTGIAPSFFQSSPPVEPVIIEEKEVYSDVMVEDYSSEFYRNNFNGWYTLEAYDGMDEVTLVSLNREFDPNSGSSNKAQTRGFVFTTLEKYGNEGVFESVSSEIDAHQAKFRTEKRKGVEYRFEGTFMKDRALGEKGEKLLLGTIEKFVNGKKVAAASGEFAYNEPHCWH